MRGVLTPKIRQTFFLTLLACAFAIVPQFRAPKGDLSLYVRTSWPTLAAFDGSWTPPAVQRVS